MMMMMEQQPQGVVSNRMVEPLVGDSVVDGRMVEPTNHLDHHGDDDHGEVERRNPPCSESTNTPPPTTTFSSAATTTTTTTTTNASTATNMPLEEALWAMHAMQQAQLELEASSHGWDWQSCMECQRACSTTTSRTSRNGYWNATTKKQPARAKASTSTTSSTTSMPQQQCWMCHRFVCEKHVSRRLQQQEGMYVCDQPCAHLLSLDFGLDIVHQRGSVTSLLDAYDRVWLPLQYATAKVAKKQQQHANNTKNTHANNANKSNRHMDYDDESDAIDQWLDEDQGEGNHERKDTNVEEAQVQQPEQPEDDHQSNDNNNTDTSIHTSHSSRSMLDDLMLQLQRQSHVKNHVALGSSSMGVLAGVTGVGAAAATGLHVVGAAAAMLTPAGPPLLIASLILGGTAAAVSTTTALHDTRTHATTAAQRLLAMYRLAYKLVCLVRVLQHATNAMATERSQTDVEAVEKHLQEQYELLFPTTAPTKDGKKNKTDEPIIKGDGTNNAEPKSRWWRRSSSVPMEAGTTCNPSNNNEDTATTECTEATTTTSRWWRRSRSMPDDDQDQLAKDDDDAATCATQVSQSTTTSSNRWWMSQRSSGSSLASSSSSPSGSHLLSASSSSTQEETNTADKHLQNDPDNKSVDDTTNTTADALHSSMEHLSSNNRPTTSLAHCAMPLAPLVDDAVLAVFQVASQSTTTSAAAFSARVSLVAVQQAASVACGALCAAAMVVEARHFGTAWSQIQQGSPSDMANHLTMLNDELIPRLPEPSHVLVEESEQKQ